MTLNPQDTSSSGSHGTLSRALADPKSLANRFGDWTQALIRMLGWSIAMASC